MKITCSCGISSYLYDYPPGDVEEGGKKMKERHIICNCLRELVIRTAPKDEPDYEGDADTNKPNLRRNQISQEELARRLGLPAPAQAAPASAPAPAPAAPPSSIILDPNAPVPSMTGVASIGLGAEEAEVMKEAVAHYGAVFKQGDEKAQAAYAELAERIMEGMFVVQDVAEARMIRTAFSERNLRRLWPVNPLDDDADHNVRRSNAAKDLADRLDDKFNGVL